MCKSWNRIASPWSCSWDHSHPQTPSSYRVKWDMKVTLMNHHMYRMFQKKWHKVCHAISYYFLEHPVHLCHKTSLFMSLIYNSKVTWSQLRHSMPTGRKCVQKQVVGHVSNFKVWVHHFKFSNVGSGINLMQQSSKHLSAIFLLVLVVCTEEMRYK